MSNGKDIQYRSGYWDLRAEKREEDDLTIEGYFVVYDDETMLWDGVYEKIDKNAFDGQLDKDIRALWGHDQNRVLARTKNKTLTLRSDNKGLWGSIKINRDDPEAYSLYQKVKRGDIDQCSFGFIPISEERVTRDDGELFIIKSCDLIEVSVVAFPAYENTSISARKKRWEDDKKESDKKDLEEIKDNLRRKLDELKSIDV